ncbi:hypothetical protein ACFSCW_01220 [Sphingomonas tabacisoli]|uniref:Uncharacterized protein n=1 Tax=Sphingomonas tabacisoli TaxID=2249466 RepID=A0ABW4HYQ3_9SPHN
MQNRTPLLPDQRPPIPDFTPVPRKYRHDGWTPERQRAFIRALAETGSVKHAANRINMAEEGAYQLRLAPGSEGFRKAWEAALDFGVQDLVDIALERARDGVPVPVFHKGEQVGERRWYNDRLLMFLLKHHMPSRYGADLHPGTRRYGTGADEDDDPDGEKALEVIRERVDRLRERLIADYRESSAQARRAFYDRYAHDPAKRAAWETLHDRPLESLLEEGAGPSEAELRASNAEHWPLLENWRSEPDD